MQAVPHVFDTAEVLFFQIVHGAAEADSQRPRNTHTHDTEFAASGDSRPTQHVGVSDAMRQRRHGASSDGVWIASSRS